jgi:catechol 2,3-dioxygenase-like lactoylglutathione lyase family enzyme
VDWRLELLPIPVTDVDRAKAFYVEQAGFTLDHDHVVSDDVRFVQLTPPRLGLLDRVRQGGQRCASWHGAGAAGRAGHPRSACRAGRPGGGCGRGADLPRGEFVFFEDPDGNRSSVQAIVRQG